MGILRLVVGVEPAPRTTAPMVQSGHGPLQVVYKQDMLCAERVGIPSWRGKHHSDIRKKPGL